MSIPASILFKKIFAKGGSISNTSRAAPQCFRKIRRESKTARKRAVCGKSTHEDQTFFPVHARFPPWLPPTGLVVKLMVTINRICVKYKFRII